MKIILALSLIVLASCSTMTPAQQASVDRVTARALAIAEAHANAQLDKLEAKTVVPVQ